MYCRTTKNRLARHFLYLVISASWIAIISYLIHEYGWNDSFGNLLIYFGVPGIILAFLPTIIAWDFAKIKNREEKAKCKQANFYELLLSTERLKKRISEISDALDISEFNFPSASEMPSKKLNLLFIPENKELVYFATSTSSDEDKQRTISNYENEALNARIIYNHEGRYWYAMVDPPYGLDYIGNPGTFKVKTINSNHVSYIANSRGSAVVRPVEAPALQFSTHPE